MTAYLCRACAERVQAQRTTGFCLWSYCEGCKRVGEVAIARLTTSTQENLPFAAECPPGGHPA